MALEKNKLEDMKESKWQKLNCMVCGTITLFDKRPKVFSNKGNYIKWALAEVRR